MRKLSLPDKAYGNLLKFILDENITDINWSQGLWVNDLNKGRYKIKGFTLDDNFIQQFYTRISNLMNVQFNKNNPLLEAETDNLRISILHDSVTNTGISISIRKTPAVRRINRDSIVKDDYCNGDIDTFMENAIRAHCTVVVGGLPGVGKTEYVKYLTQFIPAYERVYTIEDNLELRYSAINPGKDCVEIKISDTFGYSEALKASKRQLPTWVLLAEARGEEVRFLMENISAGVHCLTTVHLDDVSKLPDRLRNMGQTINENDVYSFIDIGVQIRSVVKEGEKIKRKVAQVICLSREDEKNGKTMKGLPISERPYEKVLEKGPVSLSDAELLSVILRSGTKNIPVRDMAEEILNAGNPPGLAGLLHGTVEDYKEIRGVGEVKAIQLACIGELSARIWKAAASEKTIVFDAPSKVAAFYMEEMRHLEQENLKLLLLNTKNILLRDITVSRGTVNASCATPREIYIEALRFRACGIILLHNHPSGDPEPSRSDRLLTCRIREAGEVVGITLIDHLIIGDRRYLSFRREKLI